MADQFLAPDARNARIAAMFAEDRAIANKLVGLRVSDTAQASTRQAQSGLDDLAADALKSDLLISQLIPPVDPNGAQSKQPRSKPDQTELPSLLRLLMATAGPGAAGSIGSGLATPEAENVFPETEDPQSGQLEQPTVDPLHYKPAFLTTQQALKLSEIDGQLAAIENRQRLKEQHAKTLGPYHRAHLSELSAKVEALTNSIQRAEARVDASLNQILASDRKATLQDAALERLRERCVSSVDQALLRAIKLDAMQEQHALELARRRQEVDRQQLEMAAKVQHGEVISGITVPSSSGVFSSPARGGLSFSASGLGDDESIHDLASKILQQQQRQPGEPASDKTPLSNTPARTAPQVVVGPMLRTSHATPAPPTPLMASGVSATAPGARSADYAASRTPRQQHAILASGVTSDAPATAASSSRMVASHGMVGASDTDGAILQPVAAPAVQPTASQNGLAVQQPSQVGVVATTSMPSGEVSNGQQSNHPTASSPFAQELAMLAQLPPTAQNAARIRAALLQHEAVEWKLLHNRLQSRLRAEQAEWQRIMTEHRLAHAREQELKELEIQRLKGSLERLVLGEASEGWVREEEKIARNRALIEELEHERRKEAEFQAQLRLEEERAEWQRRERERELALIRMERKYYEEEKRRAKERAKSRRWARKLLSERLLALRGEASVREEDENLEREYLETDEFDSSTEDSSGAESLHDRRRRTPKTGDDKIRERRRASGTQRDLGKSPARPSSHASPKSRTSPSRRETSRQPHPKQDSFSSSLGVSQVEPPTVVHVTRDEELESIVHESRSDNRVQSRDSEPPIIPTAVPPTRYTMDKSSANQASTDPEGVPARLLSDLEQEDLRTGQVAEVSHVLSPQRAGSSVPGSELGGIQQGRLYPTQELSARYLSSRSNESSLSSEALADLIGGGANENNTKKSQPKSDQTEVPGAPYSSQPGKGELQPQVGQTHQTQQAQQEQREQPLQPVQTSDSPDRRTSRTHSISGSDTGSEDMYVVSAVATSNEPRVRKPLSSTFRPQSGLGRGSLLDGTVTVGRSHIPQQATTTTVQQTAQSSSKPFFHPTDFGLSESVMDNGTDVVSMNASGLGVSTDKTKQQEAQPTPPRRASVTGGRLEGILSRGVLGTDSQPSDQSDPDDHLAFEPGHHAIQQQTSVPARVSRPFDYTNTTSGFSQSQASSIMTFDVPASPQRPRRTVQPMFGSSGFAPETISHAQEPPKQGTSQTNAVNNQDPMGVLGLDDAEFDF